MGQVGLDKEDMDILERALELSDSEAVSHIIKSAIGEETTLEVFGEHIFREKISDRYGKSLHCVVRGCEMEQWNTDRDVFLHVAQSTSCPANVEGFDMSMNTLEESKESWMVCKKCGGKIPPGEMTDEEHPHSDSFVFATDEDDADEKSEEVRSG